jgi:hypothetical protein
VTIEVKPGRTGSDSDVRQFLWSEERLGDDLLEELGIVTEVTGRKKNRSRILSRATSQ